MPLLHKSPQYNFLPKRVEQKKSEKWRRRHRPNQLIACFLVSLSYNHIMFGIGTQELLLILLIILIFFGPKKLPELARGLGQAIKEVRQGLKDDHPKKTTKTEK